MSRLGKKWVAVGLVWGAVFALTVWNMILISGIQVKRQALETVKMDRGYLKSHAAGIQDLLAQQARLTHQVRSYGLGFLVVENGLTRLSRGCGLNQLQVAADNAVSDNHPVSINVSAAGPVPSMVKWLAAVEDAYPYLEMVRLDIACDNWNLTGQLQATFSYRYSLAGIERRG